MITAPYNFVPLNKKVYIPYWAKFVNHDVPFEDAQSGEIDISITAKSPIFIRDSENEENFCQYNGEFYIPSSSIKGMVRNVLEIMSFSKLREENFDDNTYAVRDLSSAKNFYMSKMNQINNTTLCGWLKKIDNKYIIENCGKPGRIHHNQIDYALGMPFSKYFSNNEKKFKVDDANQKTAKYKYELIGEKFHTLTLSEKYLSESNPKYDKREFYKFDKNGQNKATLVLTGQPTARGNTGKQGDGKGFEFLFFKTINEIELSNELFEKLKFAYFDKRTTEPKESIDWGYWKEKLENGGKVPVFFQIDRNQKIEHLGLSYLYKLSYKYSIKHGVNDIHFEDNLDLTQTIFGYINKSKNEALKGRVSFSHFKAVSNIKELPIRSEILGTPRASYYPNYVRQNSSDDYSTFMDSDFSISGRKRYPIHKNGIKKTTDTGNSNVATKFKPLSDGVLFKGKLRFHNLKKVEVGAILSALTFHNTKNCFYNIGLAKSLGYGKISLTINNFPNIDEYLKEFELSISSQIEDWANSEEIKELLTMSTEQNNTKNSNLEYMKLEDFAKNKTSTQYLKAYSQLDNIKAIFVDSKLCDEDAEHVKNIFEKEREILESLKEQEKKKEQQKRDWENAKISNTIEIFNNFISKYPECLTEIEQAKKLMEQIKQNQEKLKQEELQKEANEKWLSIQKVDSKFKQKALEDFIQNYPNSEKIEIAKKELELLINIIQAPSNVNLDDLNNVKDGKRVKSILEKLSNIDDKQKVDIFNMIKTLYPTLKSKEQKNFFKDAQLARFIGVEIETSLKNELN